MGAHRRRQERLLSLPLLVRLDQTRAQNAPLRVPTKAPPPPQASQHTQRAHLLQRQIRRAQRPHGSKRANHHRCSSSTATTRSSAHDKKRAQSRQPVIPHAELKPNRKRHENKLTINSKPSIS